MARPSRPPPKPHAPDAKRRIADRKRIESALEGLVPDDEDREFIARCIAREGPPHHQAASYAIIAMMASLVERLDAKRAPQKGPRPAMKVSPHHEPDEDEHEFAIRLPRRAIERIEPDPKRADALVEALLDGPTHHALANVAMVALLDAAIARLEEDDQ